MKRIFARKMARDVRELLPQQMANINGGIGTYPDQDGNPTSGTSYNIVSGSPRVVDGDGRDTD